MKKLLGTILILTSLVVNLFGQTEDIKKEAKLLFKKNNYKIALELLKQAEAKGTDDPEVYYLLGFYSHYLAYDSRPLVGAGLKYSDKVIFYLEKAIELNPNYGNAYYFLMAEYGARALNSLRDENTEDISSNYKLTFEKGGFPLWILEYGKNLLRTCDKNGILIVGGDATYNPLAYLQTVENYRRDVTVIPYGFFNRPWYVKKIKDGIKDVLRKAPIGLTDKQIFDMHPYKWDTLTIKIPISEKLKAEFELLEDEMFKWKMAPNLIGERKKYLSADKAVLASIIEANKWERPIYFSIGCHPTFTKGLTDNFQLCGLANKLLPMATKGTKYSINPEKIREVLLVKKNIQNFKDIEKHNMPRASNILANYYGVLYKLAIYYYEDNQKDKIIEIADFIESNLLTDVFTYGKKYLAKIRQLSR